MLGHEEIVNRFGYHKGTEETIPKHQEVRELFMGVATMLDDLLPDGRAKSLALTSLQESSMWCNFAIAETAPVAFQE